MAGNANSRRRRIDWEVIERWVVTTPRATLSAAAGKFDVSIRSVIRHGSGNAGQWIEKQKEYFRELTQTTDKRLTEILAQDRADNVTVLQEIQSRLQRAAVSFLEMLFPPPDSPIEVLLAAEKRLQSMNGKQLVSAVADCARSLSETGRHIRLLTGQSTAVFERASSPDVYIPESLEFARALEDRSRAAQLALRAAAEGSPIEIEGCTIEPESAVPPTRLDAHIPVVGTDCATNKDDPDVGI